MRAVGVKASERKWQRGNQYQNWQKTSRPTAVFMFMWPERDCRDMVTLRPPEGERRREGEGEKEKKRGIKREKERGVGRREEGKERGGG